MSSVGQVRSNLRLNDPTDRPMQWRPICWDNVMGICALVVLSACENLVYALCNFGIWASVFSKTVIDIVLSYNPDGD